MKAKAPQVEVPVSPSDWAEVMNASGGDVRRLDHVTRFSSIPYSFPESVSAHSFWVCLYAAMIHRRLLGFSEPGIDVFVLLHGLIHDLPECLTGDVVRTFKYSSTELKRAVDSTETKMVDDHLPEALKFFIRSVDKEMPREDYDYVKAIVKAADFMSLFQYMNREWNRGNLEMRPFMERMKKDLTSHADVLKTGNWYEEALSHLYRAMSEATYKEPPTRTA